MTKTVAAVYDNGVLRLAEPLPLPNSSVVKVTIETDDERDVWLRVSEDKLATAWDDSDDVFNELLEK
jgi:Protein of unknown function DUF104.